MDRLFRIARRLAGALLFRVKPGPPCRRLGSDYGGWWVPLDLLNEESICYLAGVGEDITFDLALLEAVGCEAWSFDPTPRAREHVEAAATPPGYHFQPVGVWDEATTLRFYAPRNPDHVSHSVVNLQGTDEFFEAEVLPIPRIMAANEHDRIDLLKLDIEGAEHVVVRSLLDSGVHPRVFALEFDQPMPIRKVGSTIRLLKANGYRLIHRESWNYTFVLGGIG